MWLSCRYVGESALNLHLDTLLKVRNLSNVNPNGEAMFFKAIYLLNTISPSKT